MLEVLPRHIRLPPPVKVLATVRHGESQACAPLHARRGIAVVMTTGKPAVARALLIKTVTLSRVEADTRSRHGRMMSP